MKFADSRLITPTSSKLFYGFRLISFQLRRLYPIIEELSKQDRTLGEPWYLRTESEDDLSDVPVFERGQPLAAAIQELAKRSQHETGQPKIIDLWNGSPGRGKAATVSILKSRCFKIASA
jgi:hypothetical protein